MTKIATVALLSACCLATPLSAEVRWFGHLPTDGTLFAPYSCADAPLVKSDTQGLPAEYQFKGTCDLMVALLGMGTLPMYNVPALAKGKFDGAWAHESLDVTIGTVTSRIRCEQDPFRYGNSSCLPNTAEVSVSQKLLKNLIEMDPPQHLGVVSVPVMANRSLLTAQELAAAKSALTAGTAKQDLEEWNPFPEGTAEPAIIRIEWPASYEILLPGAAYSVSFAQEAGPATPAAVDIQFEGLEAVPKGGDVALPPGKTHWWQPRGSARATWGALPLQVGTDRETRHLTGAGVYRVRGRAVVARGEYQGGWTDWRTFCAGTQEVCGNIALLSMAGEETLKAITDGIRSKILVLRAPAEQVPRN